MQQEERTFSLRKNILDNRYQKTLSFLEISVAGIISTTITFALYFYQTSSTSALLDTGGYGFLIILLFVIYFSGNLSDIEEEINNLNKPSKDKAIDILE